MYADVCGFCCCFSSQESCESSTSAMWFDNVYVALSLVGATGFLFWTRLLPSYVFRAWFGLTLFLMLLLAGLLAAIARVLRRCGILSQPRFRDALAVSFAFVMHIHRFLNPHIRFVQAKGSIHWSSINSRHFLMANHQSYHDLFGGLAFLPLKYMTFVRIFFKGSLASLPIMGKLFQESGMFPVHYTSEKYEDFSVDRDRQQAVLDRVDAYLRDGGSLMLAPEGVVNRTPRQLTDFRVGSFNLAVKHKMPIYYLLYVGTSDVWPAGARIGGYPADVYMYIGKLDVNYTEGSPDLDAKALSLRLKEEMQKQLDRVYKERDGLW